MHGRSTPSGGDPTAPIRGAIRRIAAQRDQARVAAGRAMVTGEEVRAALRDQRRRLDEAAEQVADAIRTAEHAAAGARADALGEARRAGLPEDRAAQLAAASAQPFERTAAGLRSQADVLEQAARQLADVTGAATRQVADGRALVRASLHSMDAALREQLALLVELERVERGRLIDRARRREPGC